MSYPSLTRLKVAAAVLGIFMAGAPIILFNAWLSKQGDDEAAVAAVWALASAETRLGQTTSALRELAARGVDSCKPGHVDAMRQAALLTGPIKQIMQIAANGEVLCTDTGGPAARQEVLTSAAAIDPGIVLDVIRLADRSDRVLRLRKAGQPGRPSLAAIVPAGLLLPQASMQGAQSLAHGSRCRTERQSGSRVGRRTRQGRGRSSLTPCGRSNIRWQFQCRCRAPGWLRAMTTCAASAW